MKRIYINEALMKIRKIKWVDIDNYDAVSPLMTDSELNNLDLIKMVMIYFNDFFKNAYPFLTHFAANLEKIIVFQ
jgi:hypothetical protein